MPNEPFIATCKASDLAAVKEHGLPILETLQKEALHDFLSFQPGLGSTNIAIHDLDLHDFHASPEPLLQADVHEDSVAFTTPVCPEDPSFSRKSYPDSLRYVLPSEDIQRFRSAHDLELQVSCHSHVPLHPEKEGDSQHVFRGMKALANLIDEVRVDDLVFKKAISDRCYLPGVYHHNDLIFKDGENVLLSLSYQTGRGDLAKAVPNLLSILPEKYREAYGTYCRYSNGRGSFKTYASQYEGDFPTPGKSRKNFPNMHERPEPNKDSAQWSQKAYDYYTLYPLTDPSIKTWENAILASIQEMAKDGYTSAKIRSILTNSQVNHAYITNHNELAADILESDAGREAIRQGRKERDRAQAAIKAAGPAR